MANNIAVTAGSGTVLKTTDSGGVHTPHHNIDTIGAGETHIGQVGAPCDVIDVTLSLDASGAYATGDVLADTQAIANAVRVNGGRALLQSVAVLDEDDQGIAFDLVFLGANSSIGTENSAASVTDTAARDIQGFVSIAAGNFIDLGGVRLATKTAVGLLLEAASDSRSLYIAAIARGAPTHTVSGIRLKLGLVWS